MCSMNLAQVVGWNKSKLSFLFNVALIKSKGTPWASLSVNQQPSSVPHAVFLHRSLDLQHLVYPSNKIIPALSNQSWYFLCSGREGMLHFLCFAHIFCVTASAFVWCILYVLIVFCLACFFSIMLLFLLQFYKALIPFFKDIWPVKILKGLPVWDLWNTSK